MMIDEILYMMQPLPSFKKKSEGKSEAKDRLSPTEQEEENDDSSYQDSDEEEKFEAPIKNEVSQALFNKYAKKNNFEQNEAIAEEDDQTESISEPPFIFKIKNLDTGEEEEIENQLQQEIFQRKVSQGRSQIRNLMVGWDGFWKNVQKNNQNLRHYCQNGFYDEAKHLILEGQNTYPVQINNKGLDDWTPLHYACYQGHDDIVELLLQNSASVSALTKFSRNSLHIATLRGNLEVIKILVNYKVDINASDLDGNTALHFAAENGYKDIIQYLLSINCAIKKNKEGLTPINDCCDQSLKKIFILSGFKEDGEYEQFDKTNATPINKIERELIKSGNLSTQDFTFIKMLGKGSFGEVFLCKKKGDDKRLFAMKVLSKDKVMTKNLKRYALTERNVMSVINHPFMVKLNYAFQSTTKLFLVMDYYPGGDLGKLVSRKRAIPEEQARKYISQLILAFEALHKNMIVFRDLKPDNVVLDSEGHCRLTDFGLSKEGIYNNTTESFCGSVAYLAPQILSKQGHSRTVDWYLLGLLLYELIVGLPPYYNSKKEVLFDNIKRGPLKIPKTMSHEAKDLIKKLLCRDPRKRLGASRDSEELKEHQFFKGINWQEVFNRKLEMPPIQQPKINLNQTIKVSFENSQAGKKIQGWTFIGAEK